MIWVAVPSSTKWQSDIVLSFTRQLTSNFNQLKLLVRAIDNQIVWGLDVSPRSLSALERTLYSFYPDIQMETKGKPFSSSYWQYDVGAANRFVMPLRYVEEFAHFDPLAAVVNAMVGLAEDEEIIYQLELSRPTKNYYKEAQRMFVPSFWDSFKQGIASDVFKLHPPAPEAIEGGQDIKALVEEKLSSGPFVEVDFCLKVKADSDRVDTLVNMIATALSQFDSEFNWLTGAGSDVYPLVLSPNELAGLWHLPPEYCQTQGVYWATRAVSPLPVEIIKQGDGIVLGVNAYQSKDREVRLGYADRVTHVYVVGKTRVGKSTLIHRMAHQDIAAGKGVAIIDPHGDLVSDILACSIPQGREQDVVLLDIRDQNYPVGLNVLAPVAGLSDEAVAGQALAVLKKLFEEEYWSTKIEDSLYAAIRPLVSYPGSTVEDISRIFINDEFRYQVLDQLGGEVDVGFWEEYEAMHPMVKSETSNPITRRVRKFYRDPTVRRMVCQQSCLDLAHILNTNKIFLVNLGGGVDISDVDTYTIGALLVARLQLAAMSRVKLPRADRTPYYLYIDEVQNFVTTSLSKMFSEVGKYGLSLVVANQFLSQLQSATGDTLEAILGNVGTSIIFRVGTPDDKALVAHVEPNFTNQDLLNLDRFHTVVKMQAGGQTQDAFSMKTLPPLEPDGNFEDRVNRIKQRSRDTYARPVAEVNEELKQRSRSTFGQPSSDSHSEPKEEEAKEEDLWDEVAD